MKGICVMLLMALMAYYKVSKIKVQINNVFSDWIKKDDQYSDEMTHIELKL